MARASGSDVDLGSGGNSASELSGVADRLARAAAPVAVFGALGGAPAEQLAQLRRSYRQLALSVHPDRHSDALLAQRAFAALHRHYLLAQQQVQAGQYGRPAPAAPPSSAITISTRRNTYVVGAPLAAGDLASLYACTVAPKAQPTTGAHPVTAPAAPRDAILKVARDAGDNDLLENEVATLRHLANPTGPTAVPAYIPRVLDAFTYRDEAGTARQAAVFPLVETETGPLAATQWFTLREVREQYPAGVDPRQMAWIWRRLLIALGYAHDLAVIHGGVLPSHILIQPEAHGLLLVDWCASVRRSGQRGRSGQGDTHIPFISAEYEAWYPAAVLAKATAAPAVDIAMALRCMAYLLGGKPLTGWLPPTVPAPIRTHLTAALHTSQHDAWLLYHDFSTLLADLWGKRAFIPFTMPARR